MEEGSLLKQALQHSGQVQQSDTDLTKNVLIIDVYDLKVFNDRTEQLLQIAKLAAVCNTFLQAEKFRWHAGGDGPVFGVCVSDGGIPHLRAYCHYGLNVADEWEAIGFMLKMSQEISEDVAVSCWDVEDGQVILVQTSQVIPECLDEDPTDKHQYACWIRGGQIQVFKKPHISLQEALSKLRRMDRLTHASHPLIQQALEKWLELNKHHTSPEQRMPLVVPRAVATLIRNRPDLAHAAISAFCDNINSPPPNLKNYEDWVWTTQSVSRTQYAALRTIVSTEWQSSDFLPPVSAEVKRYKRQCAMESTPRIRHAVALGVRIVAGIEFLLKFENWEPLTVDKRLACWCGIDEACRVVDSTTATDSWIQTSYNQGPNHATHNLEHLLKCPVFPNEAKNLTLYSHPDVSLKQQILNAQRNVNPDEDFPMPREEDVDDESWMELESGEGSKDGDLDTILSQFQEFMVQQSGVEGVGSRIESAPPPPSKPAEQIRPRVFLNILHAVLKGTELSFPTATQEKNEDPYFFKEDYDLMENVSDNSDDDEEEDSPARQDSAQVHKMKGLMVRCLLLSICVKCFAFLPSGYIWLSECFSHYLR